MTANIHDRSGNIWLWTISLSLLDYLHIFFIGNASPLLLLLTLGTSFPMILGFFFVCPVLLPEEEPNRELYSETSCSAYEQRNSTGSRTPLLNDNVELNP